MSDSTSREEELIQSTDIKLDKLMSALKSLEKDHRDLLDCSTLMFECLARIVRGSSDPIGDARRTLFATNIIATERVIK